MTRRHLLRTAPALLALALVLAACSSPPEGEAEHMLWFANDLSDWDHSRYEAISPVPYSGELTVEDLLDGPPPDSGLRSPFPAGTRLLGWQLDQDGLLWVDLSESYGSLTGIGLTLADYCLTFTLCQLEEVERVSITVSGRTISYRPAWRKPRWRCPQCCTFPGPAAAGWALKAVRSSSRNRIP